MSVPIRIVAALVVNSSGNVLLVRKHGTRAFMQPGGKIEAGESLLATLQREMHEELGCSFDPEAAIHLGRFKAPAANEPGRTVDAEIFRINLVGSAAAKAEIAECRWVDPRTPGIPLAPLTRDHVLPLALAR